MTVPATDLCIHDLLAASCIWCTPRPGVEDLTDIWDGPEPRISRPEPAGWLVASYRSECPGCGLDIKPGDTIRYTGQHQAALCADCGEADG